MSNQINRELKKQNADLLKAAEIGQNHLDNYLDESFLGTIERINMRKDLAFIESAIKKARE